MKKTILGTLFFCFLAINGERSALALTLVDTLVFPNPTTATDSQSGTTIDFTYVHLLAGLNSIEDALFSATFALTHSGNANNGPTNEIWFALTGGGHFIGQLSESDSGKKKDTWQLSQEILNEIANINPWSLQIGLSEQTSFNGEKIQLYQSELTLNYEARNSASEREPLSTPEPGTWLMFGGGFFILLLSRRPGGSFNLRTAGSYSGGRWRRTV